jgi:predicted nuclease with TOPRIM domain
MRGDPHVVGRRTGSGALPARRRVLRGVDAGVSTWLVYAEGVREHIQAAIDQQAALPSDRRPDDPASVASLRTDLAMAREEISRLREDNDKLRRNTRRLLGQQLEQAVDGDLLARVDRLVAENHSLTEKLRASTRDNGQLRKQITDLEEDIAAARTALRRMIREQSTEIAGSAIVR